MRPGPFLLGTTRELLAWEPISKVCPKEVTQTPRVTVAMKHARVVALVLVSLTNSLAAPAKSPQCGGHQMQKQGCPVGPSATSGTCGENCLRGIV